MSVELVDSRQECNAVVFCGTRTELLSFRLKGDLVRTAIHRAADSQLVFKVLENVDILSMLFCHLANHLNLKGLGVFELDFFELLDNFSDTLKFVQALPFRFCLLALLRGLLASGARGGWS